MNDRKIQISDPIGFEIFKLKEDKTKPTDLKKDKEPKKNKKPKNSKGNEKGKSKS